MLAYHGTLVPNLDTLLPFAAKEANLKEPCVYLSTNAQLAILYLWRMPYKWLTFSFTPEGLPVWTDSFPESLRFFYEGVPGYVYTCKGDFEVVGTVGIRCAVISRTPVAVHGCRRIDDAYAELLRYEAEGTFIIRRFAELTPAEHDANARMVRGAIRRLSLLENMHPLSPFVRETFPDLWAEAVAEAQK